MALHHKLYLTLFLIGTFIFNGSTQTLDRMIAVGPMTTSYRGDLNNSYSKLSGGLNIQIVPHRDKLLQTSIEIGIANVVGQNTSFVSDQDPSREPNTFFQTNIATFALNLRAYLYRKNNFKFYLAQGIGAIRYVPKNELNEKLIENQLTRGANEKSYGTLALILPRMMGISYVLKNDYGVSLDVGQLTPRTDYIDNISNLGNPDNRDKILVYRFSVMIPIIYKTEQEVVDPTVPMEH